MTEIALLGRRAVRRSREADALRHLAKSRLFYGVALADVGTLPPEDPPPHAARSVVATSAAPTASLAPGGLVSPRLRVF